MDVHKPTAAAIPSELKQHCVSNPSDGTVEQELKRLSDLAQCQFNKQDALMPWEERVNNADP